MPCFGAELPFLINENSIGGSNPTIFATGAQRRQQHPHDNPEGDMPERSGGKRIMGASSGKNLFSWK